ncbi:MAG: BON domain-containing protein [Holosporales bacterium]|jgi:osmotically-inducible protein OsmY|nr:BON domain-containing protein [Holosporales bacterium]
MRFQSKNLCTASIAIAITSAAGLTSGCVPILIGSGVAGGGYVAAREKDLGDSITDTKLGTLIGGRLYKVSQKLYSEVSVMVDEGVVILTGIVSNPEWVTIAEKEAWAVKGVKAVENCLKYGQELTPAQIAKDTWLTTKCKTVLLATKGVSSINYKIKTVDCVVYIKGSAKSAAERQLVIDAVKGISSVKKVVSFIKIVNR